MELAIGAATETEEGKVFFFFFFFVQFNAAAFGWPNNLQQTRTFRELSEYSLSWFTYDLLNNIIIINTFHWGYTV